MEKFARDRARTKAGIAYPLDVGPLFCALIPRDVWEKVGNLDERFSIGMFEDDDYSCRLRQAGFRIAAAEDCFVHHFGNGSFGQLKPVKYDEIFQAILRSYAEKWSTKWQPHSQRSGIPKETIRLTPADLA